MYKEIYVKILAHVIIEAEKSKICRVGQRTVDPDNPCVAVQV